MTRILIVVTFVFLGLAFYEMSGGGDFNPDEVRMSRIEPPADIEAARMDQIASVQPAALQIPTTQAILNPSDKTADLTLIDKPLDDLAPLNASAEADVLETEIVLPSLILDQPVITPVRFGDNGRADSASENIRRVTGNAVNVRGGPGTEFSVVDRLVRNDEVEILENNGEGWVKMRSIVNGTEGWMADFLLSQG